MTSPVDNTSCLNVALALGLIVSEVNETQRVLTFSSDPQWVDLKACQTYSEKIRKIQSSNWQMSTDIYKAMQLIVQTCNTVDEIPKALIILSDMQFNCAVSQTGYQATLQTRIQDLFIQKNLPVQSIPVVIYWNLNSAYKNMPVDPYDRGTICLSGFSQSIF